jgi:hypothetical protein
MCTWTQISAPRTPVAIVDSLQIRAVRLPRVSSGPVGLPRSVAPCAEDPIRGAKGPRWTENLKASARPTDRVSHLFDISATATSSARPLSCIDTGGEACILNPKGVRHRQWRQLNC